MDGFGDNFDQNDVDPAAEFLAREKDQLAGLEDELETKTGSPPNNDNGDQANVNASGMLNAIVIFSNKQNQSIDTQIQREFYEMPLQPTKMRKTEGRRILWNTILFTKWIIDKEKTSLMLAPAEYYWVSLSRLVIWLCQKRGVHIVGIANCCTLTIKMKSEN